MSWPAKRFNWVTLISRSSGTESNFRARIPLHVALIAFGPTWRPQTM